MFFILCLGITLAEIFTLNQRNDLTVEFDVIENKICKGFFNPIEGKNATFKATISSEDGGILFHSPSLVLGSKTHFSFNTDKPKILTMSLVPLVIDKNSSYVYPDIEVSFDAQFDTFKKDIAKKVSVEPAMAAMTKLDNLLHRLSGESDYLAHKMGRIDYEHRRMFSFVTIFSIITLAIYFAVNSYELYSLKKFFKKKKMI